MKLPLPTNEMSNHSLGWASRSLPTFSLFQSNVRRNFISMTSLLILSLFFSGSSVSVSSIELALRLSRGTMTILFLSPFHSSTFLCSFACILSLGNFQFSLPQFQPNHRRFVSFSRRFRSWLSRRQMHSSHVDHVPKQWTFHWLSNIDSMSSFTLKITSNCRRPKPKKNIRNENKIKLCDVAFVSKWLTCRWFCSVFGFVWLFSLLCCRSHIEVIVVLLRWFSFSFSTTRFYFWNLQSKFSILFT